MDFALVAMTYLIVKHFIFDFTKLQTPWMFQNKGTYGHPGGLSHSFIQAAASVPVFIYGAIVSDWWAPGMWHGLEQSEMIGALFLFEFLVHYHMDWFKMMWCRTKGYSEYIPVKMMVQPHLAIYSGKYFLWLGIDQLVHYLTYVAMVWFWVT